MANKEHKVVIIDIEQQNDIIITTIEITFELMDPVAPAWVRNEKEYLKLHHLRTKSDSKYQFVTYEQKGTELKNGDVCEFGQVWSNYQLNIAKSEIDIWEKKCFKSADAIMHVENGLRAWQEYKGEEIKQGETIIKNGWDHEHCCLCMEKIAENNSENHAAFFNGKDWICTKCFERYVKNGFGKRLGDF